LEVDAGFAVLAECNVCGVEGAGGADGDAFFACRDLIYLAKSSLNSFFRTYHVETQSTLPLRLKHEEVHYAHCAPSAVFP
jgi:hypothetical protein